MRRENYKIIITNMWTAELKGKELNGGKLTVNVEFTNGTDVISETIDLTGGSLHTLAVKVQNRINTLETTSALVDSLELGAVPAPTPTQVNALQDAVRTLRKCEEAISLGLLAKEDKEYSDALAAVQAAAVDKAAIIETL